jgi:hypothetical protein
VGAEGLHKFGDRRERAKEADAKAAAEEAKRQRLKDIGIEVDRITEAAKDPEYDEAKLAQDSRDFTRKVTESGEMSAMGALGPVQDQVKARRKEKDDAAKAAADAAKEGKKDAKTDIDLDLKKKELAMKIQKSHGDEGVSVSTVKQRRAYKTIRQAFDGEPSAAKDVAGITAFMKSIDDGSTVRETEFKTAAEARSFWANNTATDKDGNLTTKSGVPLPGFIAQAIEKYKTGSRGAILLPEQREEMLGIAEDTFSNQLQDQKKVDDSYGRQLDDIKADRKTYLASTAEDDEKDILSAKEARKKRKEAKEKDEALKIEGSKSGPKAKIVDKATLQKIMDANAKQFTARIAAAEQRQGKPFTPAEKQAFIVELLKQNGIQTAPEK